MEKFKLDHAVNAAGVPPKSPLLAVYPSPAGESVVCE